MKTFITVFRDPAKTMGPDDGGDKWSSKSFSCGPGPIQIHLEPETQTLTIKGHYVNYVIPDVLTFSTSLVRGGERG